VGLTQVPEIASSWQEKTAISPLKTADACVLCWHPQVPREGDVLGGSPKRCLRETSHHVWLACSHPQLTRQTCGWHSEHQPVSLPGRKLKRVGLSMSGTRHELYLKRASLESTSFLVCGPWVCLSTFSQTTLPSFKEVNSQHHLTVAEGSPTIYVHEEVHTHVYRSRDIPGKRHSGRGGCGMPAGRCLGISLAFPHNSPGRGAGHPRL
jgi:hypothetical protein